MAGGHRNMRKAENHWSKEWDESRENSVVTREGIRRGAFELDFKRLCVKVWNIIGFVSPQKKKKEGRKIKAHTFKMTTK